MIKFIVGFAAAATAIAVFPLTGTYGLLTDGTLDHQQNALETSHKSNLTDVTPTTYPGYLFGDEISCILAPETSQDVFFISGEAYRQDIIENQVGVNLTMVMKFIDVNTCLPIKNMWISFWNSNAKGVYSGVDGTEAGASVNTANRDTTFLRGLVQTDMYGLATFTTIFPGHYVGRTPHLNVLAEYNGTYLDNNTYSGGSIVHVGEIFFDQDMISKVTATSAYSTNLENATLNSNDVGLAEAISHNYDPIAVYSLIGSAVEDGIVAWIPIGVNLSAATA